jgi:hemolysin activation/secretion protein
MNGFKATADDFDGQINNSTYPIIVQTPDANPQQTESPPPKPQTSDRTFVRQIKVIDSTVFTEKDFNPVLQPFIGRELTTEEIRQAADKITQLYLNQKYINSRAIPVTQQPAITDGVVVIRVIEGRLSEIEVQGTRRLNPAYIRDRIKLGAGIPLNSIQLEDQLKLLRIDPLFTNVEASLRPTGKLGESTLIVRVQEANPITTSFGVDNYSPPSVGGERLGIELRSRNLTGIGDELSGSYYHSLSGGSDVFDFSYQIPVNAMNGRVQVRAAPNRNKITEAAFE